MMQDLENECRIAVAKVYQLSDDNKALRARVAELEKAGPQYPYKDIEAERVRQDAQWGGASHDDGHPMLDWLDFIDHQITRARGLPHQIRDRLVKIAALAVAGIESIDRYETAQHWHDQEAAFEAAKP